jgi:hypothetical protein
MMCCGRKHIHQGVDAEKIYLAPDEVTDPGLGDTEYRGSFRLCNAGFLDDPSQIQLCRRAGRGARYPWGSRFDGPGIDYRK